MRQLARASVNAVVVLRPEVKTRIIVPLYVLGLVVGHAIAAWASPVAGVAIVLLTAIVSVHHADLIGRRPSVARSPRAMEQLRPFLLSFALAAVAGVVPYCLPLGDLPVGWRPAVLVIPIIVGVLAFQRLLGSGLPLRWVPRVWQREAIFALLGVPLGVIGGSFVKADTGIGTPAAIAVVSLFAVAAVEEIILRGYLQGSSSGVVGSRWAVLIAAIVGASTALGDPITAFPLALAAGLLFGWWVRQGNGLLGPALAHGLALVGMFVWPVVIR